MHYFHCVAKMNSLAFEIQNGEAPLRGLFVDRPSHMSYADLADELYNRRRSDLTVVNVLIIRHPVDEMLLIDEVMAEIGPVLERVPNLPIHVLGSFDFAYLLSGNLNADVSSVLQKESFDQLIEGLRQAELSHYARSANAILRTSGTRVFRAPSGKFCRSFLRVGNVQTNRDAIDGFFFWLLPWLKDCGVIVTETWTISSIAINAARLLARYSPSSHSRVEVDMFSQYHQRGSKLPHMESILRRAVTSQDGSALILISSSMSGLLVEGLQETIKDMGLPLARFQFGALYCLGSAKSVPFLCDASQDTMFEYFDAPPPEAGESPAIFDIDRRTYFPLRVECSTVDVRKSSAAAAADFINAYKNTGLFSVHRDSFLSNGQRHRHHAIYTDVRSIIDHPRFSERLLEKTDQIEVCPKAIISPPHAAGEVLAQRVQAILTKRFGRAVPVFQHIDLQLQDGLDELLLGIFRDLEESDSLVIVDDISATGGRLSRFQTSLRQLEFIGRVHYLVGIARPKRRTEWESRVMRLRFRARKDLPQHTVGEVEFVVLPDWNESECPWCQELEFIRLLARARRTTPECIARGHRLQATIRQEPMISDLFFVPAGAAPMLLTMNSILINHSGSQADVLCAVANALQTMRTNDGPGQSLVSHFPEINVLDPQCSLGTHFNDSVIRAAVLRAARSCELEHPETEHESARRRLAAAIVRDSSSDMNNLSFEIGIAMALYKLPSIVSEPGVEDVLRERGWDVTFAAFDAASKGSLIS